MKTISTWIVLLVIACLPVSSIASRSADLHTSFHVPGGDHWVYAGQPFDATVTVTNRGPAVSTNTVIGFSWTDDAPLGYLDPGFTTASSNAMCCDGFDLGPGESVDIVFSGQTLDDKHTSYSLIVTAGNSESAGESSASLSIVAYTEVVCVAYACYEHPEKGGGGSTGAAFLVLLFACVIYRRLNRSPA